MSVRSLFLIFVLFVSGCGSRTLAPAVHYGQGSGGGSAGVHNVNKGDTLYSISNRYRLSMQDIAVLNKLQAPFILHEGQRLRLPPPREYRVKHGDTLYGVSRLFGVDSTQVARMNDMGAPYVLRVGQVLRLPSVAKKRTVLAQKSKKSMPAQKVAAVQRSSLPASKPQETVVKDGVPVPKNKPSSAPTHITKVKTKTPKRSSSKFLKPVNGRIISNYGAKKTGLHNDGVNIAAPRGTPVKAAENGVVVYAGNALKGSGNLILLRHDNQWMTAYAHLDSMQVRQGQTIKRGAQIGKVGSSGSVTVPQLHFEVRRGTSAMNPTKYIER
jgi:murein DD-endopeptidase MepM/ murein hydrolase activator NlpD